MICFSFDDLLDAKASAPRVRELAHGVLEKRPRVQSPDRQHQSPGETRGRKATCRNADHPANHGEIDIQEVHHMEEMQLSKLTRARELSLIDLA